MSVCYCAVGSHTSNRVAHVPVVFYVLVLTGLCNVCACECVKFEHGRSLKEISGFLLKLRYL